VAKEHLGGLPDAVHFLRFSCHATKKRSGQTPTSGSFDSTQTKPIRRASPVLNQT
jgi:hypothetical protein